MERAGGVNRRGHAGRVDANHADIVKALRAAGIAAASTAMLGSGFPDVAAGFRGINVFLEIKSGGGKLTADEQKFHDEWPGQIAIVTTPEEAVLAVIEHCKKMGVL